MLPLREDQPATPSPSVLLEHEGSTRRERFAVRKRWVLVSLVTLLWHLGLTWLEPGFLRPAPPPPVEVTEIDAAKLDAIKKAWEKERPLLMSTDESKPDPNAPVPKNARYDSDRNRTVPRETRARQGETVAKPGAAGPGEQARERRQAAPPKKISLANLSNLVPQDLAPPSENAPAAPAGGGSQQLLDDPAAEGDENILNTRESVYYSFYSRIREKVGPVWASLAREAAVRTRAGPSEYVTTVEVAIDREGFFRGLTFVQRSTVGDFDRAAEEAWTRAKRFPNPPRALIGSDGLLRLRWSFSFEVQEGGGFQYAAPERLR